MRFLSIVISVLVSLDIAAREVVFAQEAAATSYSGVANSISSSAPIAACDKPGGMGLSRVVEIDTNGGPAFGFKHLKQYDFLRDKEVVLTFDDGRWPENTPAVLKALELRRICATIDRLLIVPILATRLRSLLIGKEHHVHRNDYRC